MVHIPPGSVVYVMPNSVANRVTIGLVRLASVAAILLCAGFFYYGLRLDRSIRDIRAWAAVLDPGSLVPMVKLASGLKALRKDNAGGSMPATTAHPLPR